MSLAKFEFDEKDSSIHIKGSTYNSENLSKLSKLILEINNNSKIKNVKFFGNFKSSFMSKDFIISNQNKNDLEKSLIFFYSITNSIENSNINFSCHLEGLAKGPALELAIACNYIQAEKNTTFEFNEVNNGLIFMFGSIQRLLRILGYKNTLELLLIKNRLNHKEATDFEFINKYQDRSFRFKKNNIFWNEYFTNTFIYYNSKVHAKTKNRLPAYNAILSSIFEGCLCGYEASLSVERKWVQWLLSHEYTLQRANLLT